MTGKTDRELTFLPVALRVKGRRCLVVGGGPVGTRKVNNLLRAGAAVTVVSPVVSLELQTLIDHRSLEWNERGFAAEDLRDVFLVVAATDDPSLNSEIVTLAEGAGILSCDASSSDRSQLIFGAIHRDEDTTVAVFTDGRDPGTARRTRDRIAESMLGPDRIED